MRGSLRVWVVLLVSIFLYCCQPQRQEQAAQVEPFRKTASDLFNENIGGSIEYIRNPTKADRVRIWVGEGTNTYYRSSDGMGRSYVMPHECLVLWPDGIVSHALISSITNLFTLTGEDK